MTQELDRFWINPRDGNPAQLRHAFGAFATGVTVVATWAGEAEARAFTANSFTSVSLDPPLVLVCLGKFSASLPVFEQARTFSISILGASQRDVSSGFASRDPAVKIAAAAELVPDVAPYVRNSLATLMCERHQVLDAGDHVILIGRVQRYASGDGAPLGFLRGRYVDFGPDIRELGQSGAQVVIGGVLGRDGKVLLCRRPGSTYWEIPWMVLSKGERQDRALVKLFESLGQEVTVSTPYSVFNEVGATDMTLVFSLEARDGIRTGRLADGTETALFGSADAPWDLLCGDMKQSLLKRYLRELESGLFSVYFDTPDGGGVIALDGRSQRWTDPHTDSLSQN